MKQRIFTPVIAVSLFFFFVTSSQAAIRVVSVRGYVAYKTGPVWRKPLQRGMALRDGIKISTGYRSRAVLNINGHILTIYPLTMMKVYESSLSRKSSRTRIGLRRGSVRAKINRRRHIRTSFKISTPVATSSVRGTDEIVSYGPGRGMVTYLMDNGTVHAENWNGIRRTVSGRLRFQQKTTKSAPQPLLARVRKNALGGNIGDTRNNLNSLDFGTSGPGEDPSGDPDMGSVHGINPARWPGYTIFDLGNIFSAPVGAGGAGATANVAISITWP